MATRILHKAKVKVLTWLGLAIDISSKDIGPEAILSNFTENHFVYDGVECGGMEGFLQSLKYEDEAKQIRVCALFGVKAKRKRYMEMDEKPDRILERAEHQPT